MGFIEDLKNNTVSNKTTHFSIEISDIIDNICEVDLAKIVDHDLIVTKKTLAFENKFDNEVDVDIEFPEPKRWYWYLSKFKGYIVTDEIDDKWLSSSKRGVIDIDYIIKRPHFVMAPHSFNIAELIYRHNICSSRKESLVKSALREIEDAFIDKLNTLKNNMLSIKCTSIS